MSELDTVARFEEECRRKSGEPEITLPMDLAEDLLKLVKEQPRNHGYWFFTEYEYFVCSECGEAYYSRCETTSEAKERLENGEGYKYCPYCSAIMDRKAPKKGRH